MVHASRLTYAGRPPVPRRELEKDPIIGQYHLENKKINLREAIVRSSKTRPKLICAELILQEGEGEITLASGRAHFTPSLQADGGWLRVCRTGAAWKKGSRAFIYKSRDRAGADTARQDAGQGART